MTPIFLATISPIDRLIAKPGIFSFYNQTHNGPTNSPKWFLTFSILPYLESILLFSEFFSGLWSSDNGMTDEKSFPEAKIERESPTLQMNNSQPVKWIQFKVVPENMVSISVFFKFFTVYLRHEYKFFWQYQLSVIYWLKSHPFEESMNYLTISF